MKIKSILIQLSCLVIGIALGMLIMSKHLNQAHPAEQTDQSENKKNASFNLAQHLQDVRSGRFDSRSRARQHSKHSNIADSAKPRGEYSHLDNEQFTDLVKRIFSREATEEEQLAFWKEMRNSGKVDSLIKELEDKILTDPTDIKLKLNLASMFTVKLHSGSFGPEMFAWAAKAERQWRDVLHLDPKNHDAQKALVGGSLEA